MSEASEIAPWPREQFVKGGSPASVILFVFGDSALPEPLPISRARHGVPPDPPVDAVGLTSIPRENDPAWWQGFLDEPSRSLAEEALGPDFAALQAAKFCHVVRGEMLDPADLRYLQFAWSLAKCACDHGACAVLDAHAARWFKAAEVAAWPADRPFDITREVTFIFETDPDPPEAGHIAHTRGLAKVGRPDLVVPWLSPEDAEWSGELLLAVASELASGVVLRPGDRIELDEETSLEIEAWDESLPDLHLNNEALILAPGD